MLNDRKYSMSDYFCLKVDLITRTLFDNPKTTGRTYPAQTITETPLTENERKHSAALMRINHAGEVCAQALYEAQGLSASHPDIKQKMRQAAIEEGDHLAWCRRRLLELGSHTSYLNPVWYIGSFAIGLTAGFIHDEWSLGFLAETEKQVVDHLTHHLKVISIKDQRSLSILQQMQLDEAKHRDEAIDAGAKELPLPIKKLMQWTSKMMVKIAYWL